jgi:nitrate/nitrite transporter NarK
VGILGFFLTRKFIPEDPPRKVSLPFDWAGTLLQFLFFLSMIVVVDPPSISISGGDAISAPRFLMIPLTLLLGWLFIRVESQIKAPLFDLSLLRNRTFWSANLASFLIFVSFSAVTVLMPFYLVELLKLDPSQAGLFMTAIPLTILVVAPISGRLSDRIGGRELSMVGAAIGAISLLIMAGAFGTGLDLSSTSALLIGTLAGLGFSTGLFQSPNNNAIMGVVPPSKLGVASALLATVRNLGLVTGTGLATGIFFWRKQEEGDFVSALHFALAVAGCVAAVAAVISALKPSGRYEGGAESDGQAKG